MGRDDRGRERGGGEGGEKRRGEGMRRREVRMVGRGVGRGGEGEGRRKGERRRGRWRGREQQVGEGRMRGQQSIIITASSGSADTMKPTYFIMAQHENPTTKTTARERTCKRTFDENAACGKSTRGLPLLVLGIFA